MTAQELKDKISDIVETIEQGKKTLPLRRIQTILIQAMRNCDHLIRDEKIIAAQGKEYFENKDGVNPKAELKIELPPKIDKKDNIKLPKK